MYHMTDVIAEWFQAAMMSMAFKEGVSFPPAALNKVIVAANQDIRQVWLYCYSIVVARRVVVTSQNASFIIRVNLFTLHLYF